MPNKKLVVIEWLDSHHRTGWTTEPPCEEALTCYSVGWLTHDGKEAKTLTPHLTDEETPQRCGEMTIPAQAIVSMREINL